MTAFLTSLPLTSPNSNTNATSNIGRKNLSPTASTTVQAPRRSRLRPRHYNLPVNPKHPAHPRSLSELVPDSFKASSPSDLPSLQTLPDQAKSHKLLTSAEERILFDRVKFLRVIDDAIEHLYKIKPSPGKNGAVDKTKAPRKRSNSTNIPLLTSLEIASYLQMTEAEFEQRRNFALQARNHIVTFNVRLVLSVASLVHRDKMKKESKNRLSDSMSSTLELTGTARSDLIQEGFIALIRAAEGFDPQKGNRFITYASHAIYSACVSEAAPTNCIVTVPERLRRAAQRPKGSVTNTEYLPDHLVQLARKHVYSGVSLDEKVNISRAWGGQSVDRPISRMDMLVCERSQPTAKVERDLLILELRRICYEVLTEQQADTVVLRFGLNGQKPMSRKDIAKLYGKSVSRIGQLLVSAKDTLRETVPHLMDIDEHGSH